MIRSITIDPDGYDRMTLSLTDPWSQEVVIKDIDGLGPTKGELSMEYFATGNRSFFKGARLSRRNVTMTLVPYGDNIEQIRQKLYNYFVVTQELTMEVETEFRNVKARFYVESCETDIFSDQVEMNVSLISLSPYWSGLSSIKEVIAGLAAEEPKFEFPFHSDAPPKDIVFGEIGWTRSKRITNLGDVKTGVLMTLTFKGDVKNLRITNTMANEQMRFFKETPFLAGERLIIDSRYGLKSITHINASNVYSAAYGVQTWDSSWMYIYPGINDFRLEYQRPDGLYTIEDSVELVIEYEPQYRGI
jgi:hypothetical protein rflaF_14497|nr:MAG TPA: tail protein [Caudoviricetes sp.]